MGTYVYASKAKTTNVTINGEVKPVNHFEFISRYDYDWLGNTTPNLKRAMARCENYWDRKGEAPRTVIHIGGGKPEEGDFIMQFNNPVAHAVDTPDFPPHTVLGFLHKEGRRWVCRPVLYRLMAGYHRNGCFNVEHSLRTCDPVEAHKFVQTYYAGMDLKVETNMATDCKVEGGSYIGATPAGVDWVFWPKGHPEEYRAYTQLAINYFETCHRQAVA